MEKGRSVNRDNTDVFKNSPGENREVRGRQARCTIRCRLQCLADTLQRFFACLRLLLIGLNRNFELLREGHAAAKEPRE